MRLILSNMTNAEKLKQVTFPYITHTDLYDGCVVVMYMYIWIRLVTIYTAHRPI